MVSACGVIEFDAEPNLNPRVAGMKTVPTMKIPMAKERYGILSVCATSVRILVFVM